MNLNGANNNLSVTGGVAQVRTVQLGFPVELTSSWNGTTGYSWKQRTLTGVALGNPSLQLTGNKAVAVDGNTTYTSGQYGWLEPDQEAGGWLFVVSLAPTNLTVEEVDGSPSYSSITTIRFDQADGFVVSQPGANIARIDLSFSGSAGDVLASDGSGHLVTTPMFFKQTAVNGDPASQFYQYTDLTKISSSDPQFFQQISVDGGNTSPPSPQFYQAINLQGSGGTPTVYVQVDTTTAGVPDQYQETINLLASASQYQQTINAGTGTPSQYQQTLTPTQYQQLISINGTTLSSTLTESAGAIADAITVGGSSPATATFSATGSAVQVDLSNFNFGLGSVGITGVSSSGIPQWTKYTVGYAAFSAAATVKDIELFVLPIKGVMHATMARHTAIFTNGVTPSGTIDIGIASNFTKYGGSYSVSSAVPTFATTTYGSLPGNESATATTSIRVRLTTAYNTNTLTSGSIDIWVLTTTLP